MVPKIPCVPPKRARTARVPLGVSPKALVPEAAVSELGRAEVIVVCFAGRWWGEDTAELVRKQLTESGVLERLNGDVVPREVGLKLEKSTSEVACIEHRYGGILHNAMLLCRWLDITSGSPLVGNVAVDTILRCGSFTFIAAVQASSGNGERRWHATAPRAQPRSISLRGTADAPGQAPLMIMVDSRSL